MFKFGDRVRLLHIQIVRGSIYTGGEPGVVTAASVIGPFGAISTVRMDCNADLIDVFDTDLELILPHTLPTGSKSLGQATLGLEDTWAKEWDAVAKPKPCDCGGYKTYKSYSPANHSRWCSSQE